MSYQTLELSKHPKFSNVLKVTLNRPEVRNAFNEVLISELSQVFKKECSSSEVRAVVLGGEGKLFCAGGDLNWMKKAVDFSLDENLKDTLTLAKMFHQLNTFSKPIFGAIHGAAIGGGVGLVSICDFAVASQSTVFSLSEVRLGLVPACIGPFVIPKIGPSHARRYFTSGERFGADRAYEIGLVHEVVGDDAEIHTKIDSVLEHLMSCGPQAVSVAKRLVSDLSTDENSVSKTLEHVARILSELRVSKEGQEGVRAFLEKRKPSWSS